MLGTNQSPGRVSSLEVITGVACFKRKPQCQQGCKISIYGACIFMLINTFPFASSSMNPAQLSNTSFHKMVFLSPSHPASVQQLQPLLSGVHLDRNLIFLSLTLILTYPTHVLQLVPRHLSSLGSTIVTANLIEQFQPTTQTAWVQVSSQLCGIYSALSKGRILSSVKLHSPMD